MMIVTSQPGFNLVRRMLDLPAPGAWNMAVDEVLLESALSAGRCTVRCYRWSAPTLSLGYFQRPLSRSELPERCRSLACVRRLSGGGAILHHHELTYSIALPASHPLACDPHRLYTNVHTAVIARLARRGCAVAMRGQAQPERNAAFLCFARGEDTDVVLGTHKVLGSAQRRRKGAILQHGSLVLKASPFAPEIPGLEDLIGRSWEATALAEEFLNDLGQLLGETLVEEPLSIDERHRAERLAPAYRIDLPDATSEEAT